MCRIENGGYDDTQGEDQSAIKVQCCTTEQYIIHTISLVLIPILRLVAESFKCYVLVTSPPPGIELVTRKPNISG